MTNDTTCSAVNCKRASRSRGWCNMHYLRWYKYGDPNHPVAAQPERIHGTPEERFWPKVDASGDCWEWTRSKNKGGYGQFSFKGHSYLAHKYAYESLVGPVPPGLELDHRCRNHACCNPDHLEPVTRRVNIMRGVSRSSINARKTHCIRNHEFTPENTIKHSNGSRRCRRCHNAQVLARYHADKGRQN
jgi:hypothetical protein